MARICGSTYSRDYKLICVHNYHFMVDLITFMFTFSPYLICYISLFMLARAMMITYYFTNLHPSNVNQNGIFLGPDLWTTIHSIPHTGVHSSLSPPQLMIDAFICSQMELMGQRPGVRQDKEGPHYCRSLRRVLLLNSNAA